MALSQALIFPVPGFVADKYFEKNVAPVVVSLPLYCFMLGNGMAQWCPMYFMNDTLDKATIYDRYQTLKLLGIFTCAPAILTFIPFWLYRPPINQEFVKKRRSYSFHVPQLSGEKH